MRRVLEYGTQNIDSVMIGRLLGVGALGFYDKAFSIGNKIFQNMTSAGPAVSFRIFAIIQDDPKRFQRAFHKVILTVTLLGYFVLTALGTTAPHLIVVALGDEWRPAIVPLQLLCVSFAFKLLNRYATSAAHARGWVWPQIWRQAVHIVFIAVGVGIAIPWGLVGAAAAVLVANILMFFLTQGMMRAATGLGWSDVLRPQVPAVCSAAALGAVLWLIDAGMAASAPFVVLIVQGSTAAVFALLFAWWCPFEDARMLMYEVISDVSPRLAGFVWKDLAAAEHLARLTRRKSTHPSPV
jgi:O-antigen/teichoic acid export membrane protein